MKIIEGKSPTERNKILAALVLGALALLAIVYNVIGLFPSRKAKLSKPSEPAVSQPASAQTAPADLQMPTQQAADFEYESTELTYTPGSFGAPAANRNIFGFYEPPPPTPVPQPTPVVVVPTPTPPPPMDISSILPQSVYAGSKAFRLEVSGSRFTPQTRIYFNGSEMPTSFINERKLTTEVPANLIATEGMRTIRVRTPDGLLYSNDFGINVMVSPKPTFTYLGPLVRRRSNNDTAYIQEQGSQIAAGRRLNDIIGGRFRLVSISPSKVVVEDVNLGFRHSVNISNAAMQAGSGISPSSPPMPSNFVPYNPNMPVPAMPRPGNPNRPQPMPDEPDSEDGEVVDN